MNKYDEIQRLPLEKTVFRTPKELKDGLKDTNRRPNVHVTYQNYAPGAGGDIWVCRHQDGTLAYYWASELEDVE